MVSVESSHARAHVVGLDTYLSHGTSVVAVVVVLFAAVTGLRFWVDPDVDGVALLYTLPIALVAVRFGSAAGLAAAAVGGCPFVVLVEGGGGSAGA